MTRRVKVTDRWYRSGRAGADGVEPWLEVVGSGEDGRGDAEAECTQLLQSSSLTGAEKHVERKGSFISAYLSVV